MGIVMPYELSYVVNRQLLVLQKEAWAAQQDDIEELINLFAPTHTYKKCEHVVLPSRRKNSLIKCVFCTQDGLQTYKYFSDDINPMRRGVHNR